MVEDVQATVARTFESIWPRASFKATGYFNHSFVPDIVATWPPASEGSGSERHVYLRPGSDPVFISNDLDRLGAGAPTLVSLGESDPELNSLQDAIGDQVNTSLVTNTFALDVFSAEHALLRQEWLASDTVLQRGRGIVGSDEAEALESASEAFGAALESDDATVRNSLETFGGFLPAEAIGALNRYLFYLWSSASAARYPGQEPIGESLTEDEAIHVLRYILRRKPADSSRFWDRLAAQTSLARLEALQDLEPGPGLNRLMKRSASQILVRAVHAVTAGNQEEALDLSTPFDWRIADSVVELFDDSTTLRFVGDLRRLRGAESTFDPPTLDQLQERLLDLSITELDITTRDIEADLRGSSSTAHRSRVLTEVAEGIGASASIRRLQVRSNSGVEMMCEMTRRIAQALDPDTAPMSLLALTASKVIVGLDRTRLQRIEEALSGESSDRSP
jgi:hypothetical protein